MAKNKSEADPEKIAYGWSASEVHPDELVDDAWIEANTNPGKRPSKARHVAARARQFVDPRTSFRLSQSSPFTRDQMRRIAARTGYPYVEAWSAHDKGSMKGVWGALCHHTGTSWSAPGDYPTLRVVRDGRPGLVNSLCAFGLGRSGRIYLVNTQVSWHAGVGSWNGLTDGNGYLAGIEAESDGKNWTAEEVDAYPRLVASILIEINSDDKYTTRHASFAKPAGRKVDFSGWPGGNGAFWSKVYFYLANRDKLDKNAKAPIGPPIIGAIRAAYDRPGIADRLGKPITPESDAEGGGRWQNFDGGAIYWHPNVDGGNAHVLWGGILAKFRELGVERVLGYPTTDELGTTDGIGRYNHFSNGHSIYWTPDTGANQVGGGIRAKWEQLGWEVGYGYPITDEMGTPDGVGRYNHFTGDRSIYWTPAIGPVAVGGTFRSTWVSQGWENGPWGYPKADETVEGGVPVQDFVGGRASIVNGVVVWFNPTGTTSVNSSPPTSPL